MVNAGGMGGYIFMRKAIVNSVEREDTHDRYAGAAKKAVLLVFQ